MHSSDEPNRRPLEVSFATSDADIGTSVIAAMAAARAAQARWVRVPVRERLKRIREVRRLFAEYALDLAEASASARQRPALESLTAEVLPLAEACRFLEREAAKLLAPRRLGSRGRPLWLTGVRSEIQREPFGVVLIIGPGNYPLLLPGVQLVQALVAGNAVLLKPGIGGTAAANLFIYLLHRAGFDTHLVQLLPESADAARAAIEAGPDKVIFTGSAATGEKLLAQLAPRLIPATVELSGCDAVLVRADADLDLVVKALTFGLTLNDGATCLAPHRVFVARACATELEGRLSRAFQSVAPRRLSPEVTASMLPLLREALSSGAHFISGEVLNDGTIRGPVVLGGISGPARLLREDIFAPVLSIVTVTDDYEAISRANACPFALGVSIFTRDESAGQTLATQLHAGVVTVNDLIVSTADARLPFGGRGRSGYGVTRGAEGLLELTAPKVVTVTRSKFRPAFETPHGADAALFHTYLQLTHGGGWKARARALFQLARLLKQRRNLKKS